MTTVSRLTSRVVRITDTDLVRRFSKAIVGIAPKVELILKAAKLTGRFGSVLYADDCEDCIQGFVLGHIGWPTTVLVDWLVVPVLPKDRCELAVAAVLAGLREDYQGVQVAVRSRYPEDQSLEFLAALKKAAKGDLTRDHDDSEYYRLPDLARQPPVYLGGSQSYSAKMAARPRGRRSSG